MRKFDYSFLKGLVPSKLLNSISSIYDIKARKEDRFGEYPKIFESFRNIAFSRSIKYSNQIDSIYVDDKRLNDLLDGKASPKTTDEKMVVGYKNVLTQIYGRGKDIIFDETTILSMHRQLFNISNLPSRGRYKKEPNILSELVDGKRLVKFVPLLPSETSDAINQMVLAYYDAKRDPDIHPLLLISCVIADFLYIHPFETGNGRMARLITALLLSKYDFDVGMYISLDELIYQNRDDYSRALQDSSTGWKDNKNDYFPFISFLIQIIYSCYQELDEKVYKLIGTKMNKSERIEYYLLNAFVPVSKAEIAKNLPDISIKMIETVLAKLIKERKIVKMGSFRNAVYYRL